MAALLKLQHLIISIVAVTGATVLAWHGTLDASQTIGLYSGALLYNYGVTQGSNGAAAVAAVAQAQEPAPALPTPPSASPAPAPPVPVDPVTPGAPQ